MNPRPCGFRVLAACPRGPPCLRLAPETSTWARLGRRALLLRKEVIQQRLPCYDFIPITTHTFDGYPPYGLVHRLRVQTAFMM